MSESVIQSSSISLAWAAALRDVYRRPRKRSDPLMLSIAGFEGELPDEDDAIRADVDRELARLGKMSVQISALTIFPYARWSRRGRPPCDEFSAECIDRLLPRMKRLDQRNRLGTYFERMMAFTGTARNGSPQTVNQLQFVIDLMRVPGRRPRQSALQIACFDPAKDHSRQTRRGFPCLQQVSVTYEPDGRFALNAYYPTQFLFDRGYGNYLGLCHLGCFIAHQSGTPMARLNCFVARPELGDVSKRDLAPLIQSLPTSPNGTDGRAGGMA